MENREKKAIHIFGASGSGTTTLGKYISEKLGYTFLDTDDYFWLPTDVPFTKVREEAQRIEMLKNDVNNSENVVISGYLVDWGDEIISKLTLAIRLVTDTNERLRRIQNRGIIKYGNRILPGGDMYKQYQGFVERAANYDKGDLTIRSKQLHDVWQKKLTCEVIVLSGEDSLEYNYEKIRNLTSCRKLF